MQKLSFLLLISTLAFALSQESAFDGKHGMGSFGGMGQFGGGNGQFGKGMFARFSQGGAGGQFGNGQGLAMFKQKMLVFKTRPEYARLSGNAKQALEEVMMVLNSPSGTPMQTVTRMKAIGQRNPAAAQELKQAVYQSYQNGGPLKRGFRL
ncbi:unnamed protein product [Bursaphelenchus okinawaensis]|uniref:DUF148 domain-containing protein n=1 Tax=Bursaphelenchus okinawaensis TaxID=465554 RepID=A0A811LA76_9BILA|nr:unnamed protein product [Bursaphelenchus okinawaensis]CAG9121937.1 unnamed protein product [Bursaphelenchus okinawaensis]